MKTRTLWYIVRALLSTRSMMVRGVCNRHLASAFVLVAALLFPTGCDKKAPPDIHLQRGYALLQSDPDAALREFQISRKPQESPALVGQALALEGLQRYSESKTLLERALGRGTDDGVRVLLARVHIMLGELEEARESIDEALKNSKSVLALLLLEACLADVPERAESSLAHLDAWLKSRRAAEVNPSIAAEFYVARASVLETLGRLVEAKRDRAEAGLQQVPEPREALSLAVVAARAERNSLAAGLLERLLGNQAPPPQLLEIGELALQIEQPQLVARVLALSTDVSPKYALLQARFDFARQSPCAVKSLRVALKKELEISVRDELRLMLATALLQAGELREAQSELTKKFSNVEFSSKARVLRARVALAGGQVEEAFGLIAPLLEKKPSATAREVAALALIEKGDASQALKLVRSLLKEDPTHPTAARMLVSLSLGAGQGAEVERELRARVEHAPSDLRLRLLWIEVVRKTQSSEKVTAALQASVKEHSSEPQLWLSLSDHLKKQGESAAALKTLRDAHQANPRRGLLTAALAGALSHRGLHEEAAPLYEKVLESSEDDVVALNNLAMYYTDRLNEPQRAVPLAERAHKMNPTPAIADTLAWALVQRNETGDLERALQLLEPARRLTASPTTRYHLGAALIAQGEENEGRPFIQSALADPRGFDEAESARKLLAP